MVVVEVERRSTGDAGGHRVRGDALVVRVSDEGDGNGQAIAALSAMLGIDVTRVDVIAGMCVRRKRLLVRGTEPDVVAAAIGELPVSPERV